MWAEDRQCSSPVRVVGGARQRHRVNVPFAVSVTLSVDDSGNRADPLHCWPRRSALSSAQEPQTDSLEHRGGAGRRMRNRRRLGRQCRHTIAGRQRRKATTAPSRSGLIARRHWPRDGYGRALRQCACGGTWARGLTCQSGAGCAGSAGRRRGRGCGGCVRFGGGGEYHLRPAPPIGQV